MNSRVLNIFGSALITVSAFFFVSISCPAEEGVNQFVAQSATVSELSGKVEVLSKDALIWEEAKAGAQLTEGDKIRTAEEAKVQLTLQDGSFIKLKENTTLGIKTAREEISTKATQYNLDFRLGEIMVQLRKLKKGSSFKVKTPTAVAAVRGTTFYMRTGTVEVDGEEQPFTDLYLESDDIINFTNTISGESYDVYQYEVSSSYGDGAIEEPETLPSSAQDAWRSGWDVEGDADVDDEESEEDTGDVSEDVDDATETQDDAQEDAAQDQTEEQNITGLQKQDVVLDSDGDGYADTDDEFPLDYWEHVDTDSDTVGDFEDAFPADKTIDSDTTFNDIYGNPVTVRGYGSRDELRQATIDNLLAIEGLKQDIYDMIDDIQVRQFEGLKEQIFDHQAGKVMTDRWGNRVRVEEYISKPTNDQVQILALNLRTAGPNAGISSLDFRVTFDEDISNTDLKTLPWGDYMDSYLVNEVPQINAAIGKPYAQLILYEEDNSGYYNPKGTSYNYPIPLEFSIEVKNPHDESVKATETYSDIIKENPNIWYQVQVSDEINIKCEKGEKYYYSEDYTGSGGKSWNPVTNWGEGWNQENRFTFLDYYDADTWLIGAFYLIDDNGNLIDVEDGKDGILEIHGIRDCINPDYNLEMIFFSSEFAGTDPNLPNIIAENVEGVGDAYERYLYNTYRNIDVITIPEITFPYRDWED